MKRVLFGLFLVLCPLLLEAQNPNGNYNPYVNGGMITPSPLLPLEVNGTGVVSFNIGNTGSDHLDVFTNQYITLTITLSCGVPDNANPLAAVSGSSAGLFSWSYNSGTYTGMQSATIPSNSSGTITIAFKVTQNSVSPGSNGFNVNITPAPYQTTSNTQNDDAVSSYTYTEIRDFGDAPVTYGSADHIIDFVNYLGSVVDGESVNQPSAAADADDTNGQDDEDGIIFPVMTQGAAANISVTVVGIGYLNGWVDWNGDGDFADADEQIAINVPGFTGTANLAVTVPSGAMISAPVFARFRFSPLTLASSSGSAIGGEVEDYRFTILTAPLGPTVPAGLKISSSSVSSVSIAWDASTDNMGVTGYRIYRGGIFLGTSILLTYTDNSVSPGNYYTYTVSAIDADNNESGQSPGVIASTFDTVAPSVPMGLHITSMSESSISIAWDVSTDNVGVTGYRVYLGGVLISTVITPSYTDNNVNTGSSYTYSVSAIDAPGNESGQSSISIYITAETDLKIVNKISIYPNPSDGKFMIEINEKSGRFNLEIISSNGITVERSIIFPTESLLSLTFDNLKSGVYHICIFNKERYYYGKLVIEK